MDWSAARQLSGGVAAELLGCLVVGRLGHQTHNRFSVTGSYQQPSVGPVQTQSVHPIRGRVGEMVLQLAQPRINLLNIQR